MKITLKNIIVIALAVFIIIALLVMPYMTASSPNSDESESATFGEAMDMPTDTGLFTTFTIFSIICSVGMAGASVFVKDKRITVGIAAAGLVCLFIAMLGFPSDISFMGEVVAEFGYGAGIWLSLISFIAAGAISFLEIPALDKSLQ